uniref:Endo/exonuclease/phosphatase domain-containing protein n=1 Tax=Angiostrongylus cantonensis TaxID=6313 RepID=A0A0K0DQM0_ANGCA
MVTICTYNARTLASESSIEGLLMQARMIKHDVMDLAETRRRHPFSAAYDTGEELFLGTCVWPRRDDATHSTTLEKNCSSEHATAEA